MPGVGEPEHIESVLAGIGLDTAFAAAAEDTSWDDDIRADTEAALDRTGRDVGTPIIAIGTEGPAFFGPVISRIPDDVEAVELWDSVIKLAEFGGFAELKRSLREMPRLAALGWDGGDETAPEQDWQGGSVASN